MKNNNRGCIYTANGVSAKILMTFIFVLSAKLSMVGATILFQNWLELKSLKYEFLYRYFSKVLFRFPKHLMFRTHLIISE